MTRYRLGVDIGGTFTDLVLVGDDGSVLEGKVASTPDDYARAIVNGLRELAASHGLAGEQIDQVIHGTTVAANTLLEHRGARTALLTTQGFRDVLEIGRGRRPDMYDLFYEKPRPLAERALRLEIDERVLASGEVERPLDQRQARGAIERLRGRGVEAVAISLINAFRNGDHERQLRALVEEILPGVFVSVSSEVLPSIKEYERTSTAVVNAYVGPVVSTYLAHLERDLVAEGVTAPLEIMQSSGGVSSSLEVQTFPVRIVESGPAAGALAAARLAAELGIDNAIAFDMGGTTAKASLIERARPRFSSEYEVGAKMNAGSGLRSGGGYVIGVPVLDIAEVGAGGGSIAWVDPGGALQVGPRSAGARPGPACYNLGGSQPTVTDANVALGYINPHAIAGGGLTLAPGLAHTALAQVAEPLQLSIQDAAWAVHRVANATMMRALRAVSTERGRDPRDFTLVAFGGSGPLHAAAAARELGIRRVLVPPAPGLFSALGLLLADAQLDLVRTAFVSAVDADPETMEAALLDMERAACEQLSRQGFGADAIRLERSAEMHYRGQSTELGIGLGAGPFTRSAVEDVVERFEQEHERSYGYRTRNEPVEIVNLRLRVSGVRPSLSFQDVGLALLSRARDHAPASSRPAYFGPELGVVETAVLRRADLSSQPRRGPFIVEEFDTTIVVPPDCLASLDQAGNIVLLLDEVAAESEAAAGDPITFAVIKNALHAIADEMALTIWRTGRSIGAKDILDYSTALFDAQGRLVAQGVTSPVQLGGISGGMQSVLERFGDSLKPGDVILFNDPYAGGMHLPDILVYRPIFLEGERIGFAGVLLHHADMGGRVPGGNAADSTEIFQEGLRLPPLKLYSEGVLNETLWDLIATNVRVPDLVLGDIQAQWAACYKAEQDLLDLVRRYGLATLRREMQALLDYSARMTRAEIAKLPDGEYSFEDWLDDDGVTDDPVRLFVTARVSGDRLQISFDGSSPQTRGAMNMTMAATRSTVYFCVRSIMGMDIPVNAGFCDAVEVSAPLGSVANLAFPASCGARGATLFRTIDCLFGMLGKLVPERVWAASDGGCSIVVFAGRHDDNRPFISFETVSGCWGGRPDRDGVEGITTPGINMRNTPIEVIEAQFPLIMQRYGYMADTGGPGQFRGGLSVEREYRFVGREAVLQIRSDRRRFRPFGVAGGGEGSPSLNLLNPGPAEQVLRSKITTTIGQGEVYRHLLPGAGGWGPPLRRDPLRVLDDLRNEKVSREHARTAYGVVVTADESDVDWEATRALRLKRQRGVDGT